MVGVLFTLGYDVVQRYSTYSLTVCCAADTALGDSLQLCRAERPTLCADRIYGHVACSQLHRQSSYRTLQKKRVFKINPAVSVANLNLNADGLRSTGARWACHGCLDFPIFKFVHSKLDCIFTLRNSIEIPNRSSGLANFLSFLIWIERGWRWELPIRRNLGLKMRKKGDIQLGKSNQGGDHTFI